MLRACGQQHALSSLLTSPAAGSGLAGATAVAHGLGLPGTAAWALAAAAAATSAMAPRAVPRRVIDALPCDSN